MHFHRNARAGLHSLRVCAEPTTLAPEDHDGRGVQGLRQHGRGVHVRGPCTVAVPLCASAHLLYTRFAKRIGASISGPAMRPNPRDRLGPGVVLPHLVMQFPRGDSSVTTARSPVIPSDLLALPGN